MSKTQGFSLIELMIVVVIIGILASIIYPSYSEYVRRSNRVEGRALLEDAAARQERYFSQNLKYADTLEKLGMSAGSTTGKYTLSLVTGTESDGGYLLTASQQFNDTKCGNLTLNAVGVRGATASGANVSECWR